jgi:hypothetical protein
VIAVSKQTTAQELAALSPERAFVLVENVEALTQVAEAAHQHGHDRFLLLTYPANMVVRGTRTFATAQGPRSVSVAPIGPFGSYRFHEVVVTSGGEGEHRPDGR